MKTYIKKINAVIIAFVMMFCISISDVFALGIKAPSSVAPNSSFNVSVNGLGDIRGKFFVNVENGSSKTKAFFANGSSSASFQVKAGSSGIIRVVVSPDTSSDTATIDGELITSSVSTTIKIKSSSTGGGSSNNGSSSGNNASSNSDSTNNGGTTQKPEDNRSKENKLSSLTVSAGNLSPKFDSSKTSYTVDLSSETESLTISAKAKDVKAKVSGTGTKALKIGTQAFEIECTAENGSKKSYIINVNVTEKPTVFTSLGDKKLGVLKNLSGVKSPNGFEGATVELEGETVTAWKNETSGLTLVYLMDETGNKNFYIVENNKVSRKYENVEINGRTFTLVNTPKDLEGVSGLKQSKVKIGDLELDGWSYDDEALQNYSIVYLMNSDGKAQLYSYEATEGTLQIYTPATESNSLNTLTYVFIGTTVVASVVAIAGFVMYFNFKKKSISAIKDYYEKKNQG